MVVWLVVAIAMAAGCATPIPAREIDPGAPAGEAAEKSPIETPSVPADAQPLVDLAQADLSLRLGDKAGRVTLLSVEKTDFPDASLGVPEPDKMYAQVITPGYVLRFGVEGKVYIYHGAGERVVLVPETESSGEPSLAESLSSASELERALGDRMLNDPSALCEWEVWGSGEQVLYLWAVCESASGSAVSAPAVAYLDGQGGVAAVNMPGDGTHYAPDVRRLFPPEVEKRILAHEFDARSAMERIGQRRLASQ
jgi:hypothetical protein